MAINEKEARELIMLRSKVAWENGKLLKAKILKNDPDVNSEEFENLRLEREGFYKDIAFSNLEKEVGYLVKRIIGTSLGEILTVIDGSITGEVQNKAIKDLIKKSIYSSSDNLEESLSNTFSSFGNYIGLSKDSWDEDQLMA